MTDKPRLPFKTGKPNPKPDFVKAAPIEQVSTTMEAAVRAFIGEDTERLKHEYPVDPSKEPVTLREEDIRPLESLSTREQAELRAKIAELANIDKRIAAKAQVFAQLDEALDVNRQKAAAAGLVVEGVTPTIRNNVIPEPEVPEADTTPTENDDSGIQSTVKRCPRCHHDMNKTAKMEVTENDRYAWLLALHGARFRKTYSLAGGKLFITFRSLSPQDTQLAYEQTGIDMQGKAELGLPAYYAKLWENRLALSLEKVEFSDGRTYPVPTERLLAGRPIGGKATVIPAIYDYIRANVAPSESLLRLVGRKFTAFQDLNEQLEQEIEGDFIVEISGQS